MILRKVKNHVRAILRPPLHQPTISAPFYFLGTEYGGWPLLKDTPYGALIFSFGVGEDISFDVEAVERFGAQVHAFDPTPKSKAWIARQSLPEGFHFHPEGVASRDGEAEFCPPSNSTYVSYASVSASNRNAPGAIKAPVRRIRTLIDLLDRGEPEIVKMDVEGFEYEVIKDMLEGGVRPRQLLIEFHQGLYGFSRSDTISAVEALKRERYDIFFVSSSGREYAFCRCEVDREESFEE